MVIEWIFLAIYVLLLFRLVRFFFPSDLADSFVRIICKRTDIYNVIYLALLIPRVYLVTTIISQ